MELIWATDDFKISGLSYPGFPILLDASMNSVEPANRFLRHWLIHRGCSGSRKSWATIGHHLYDFFESLERLGLKWDGPPGNEGESPLAAFRHYSIQCRELNPRTVNQRIGTIVRFYTYAHEQGWIRTLPFSFQQVQSHGGSQALFGHLARGKTHRRADVMMRVQQPGLRYLPREQIKLLLRSVRNPTHKLMIRVGLQTGLRREEIASLPVSYIRSAVHHVETARMVRIHLNPRDGSGQKTKGSRERSVYFPSNLIRDLWEYAIHDRERGRHAHQQPRELFLTAGGMPWSKDGKGFHRVLKVIGEAMGISLHPHLLRHTYATYTLASLQQTRRGLDPIVFVQRQLGHASIHTTLAYAHLANELAIEAVTAYDAEISEWSR